MSTTPLILVLGANGTVGRACVEYLLTQNCWVLAGVRNLQRLPSFSGEQWQGVLMDIQSATEIPTLNGKTPAVVINCTPSYRFSEAVLKLCLAQNIGVFIDVGGEEALIDKYHQSFKASALTAVMGAGVQAGLSGLAICAVVEKLGGLQPAITSYIGGLQPLTPAGLEDYLRSVQKGSSQAGKCWDNGSIVPLELPISPPNCFPQTASAHASLDEEGIFIAKQERLARLETYNVMDSLELASYLHTAISTHDLSELPSCEQLNTCLFGRQPYFRICTTGTVNDQQKQALAFCRDSYVVSGQIAATAALWALQGRFSSGLTWFAGIAEPLRAWDDLATANNHLQLNWNEVTATDTMETGSL